MRACALATAAVAACVALASAGCGGSGGDDDGVPPPAAPADAAALTAAEREALREDEAAIVSYCRARALSLTDPDKRPTVGQQARALEAVDSLLQIAAEKPDAQVKPRVDLVLFLGDLAENLEGSNCDPQVVGRLDQGLAQLGTAP